MYGPFDIERALEEARGSGFPWYVYTLIRPDNGEPFYVGKGSKDRLSYHLRLDKSDRNNHKKSIIRKCGGYFIYFNDFVLFEREAFEIEKQVIQDLLKAGYKLTNQTKGGEGVSGYRPNKLGVENISKGVRRYLENNPKALERLRKQARSIGKLPNVRSARQRNMTEIRRKQAGSDAERKRRLLNGIKIRNSLILQARELLKSKPLPKGVTLPAVKRGLGGGSTKFWKNLLQELKE